MSAEIPLNNSLVYQIQPELNISMMSEVIQNASLHPVSTRKPYDHLGAMRFTVAVVLVYGVGVIGVLGIYARRKANEKEERDTNTFLKGLQKHRDMIEKQVQLAEVQDVIRSIHGKVPHFNNAPPSTIVATQGEFPAVSVRRYWSDASMYAGRPEVRSLMARRLAIPRSFSYSAVGKEHPLPETEDDDEIVSTGFNETTGSEEVSTDIDGEMDLSRRLLNSDQDLATPASQNASGDNSECTVRITENTSECGKLVFKHTLQRGFNVDTSKVQDR